ncbi:MAG: hypothetical protein A2W61_02960 [Deltaproteobacteria bacterium RIFCSPLOWO2_01_44_7]|nr:MAG: hypothetical protein A2W61_02960 [Deltaproteobacteria bacterium RIFCSPLOWO2_01_44_7]OGQ43413.1 MAG: hypothetical protein A3I70_01980 [Deltaproteobacteria bacterium RIFCSPLOWO2_02_FULL_44_34]
MPEISFRLFKGLLYMPVTITNKGQKLLLNNCIFDTGSAGTTFDTEEAAKIGIKSTLESKLKRLVTVGGYQTVFTHCVDILLLGNQTLHKIEVEVGNLHSKFGIEGIIGTDLMRLFDWEIIFSQSKIRMYEFHQVSIHQTE